MPFKVSYYGTPSQTNTVVKKRKDAAGNYVFLVYVVVCVQECSLSRDARASVCGYLFYDF